MKKLLSLFLLFSPLFLMGGESKLLKGFLELDLGYLDKKSNGVNAMPFKTPKNQKLQTLKTDGERFSSFLAMPRFNILYKNSEKSYIFLGNQKFTNLKVAYGREIFFGKGEVGYTPSFSSQWDNPYEVTKKREKATLESHTFFLKLQKESFAGELFYQNRTQHNDKTLSMSSLGRSGVGRGVSLSQKVGFHTFKLTHFTFKALGKSDSYRENELGYTLFLPLSKKISSITNLSATNKKFEKEHLLFHKTREENSFRIATFAMMNALFKKPTRYLSLGVIAGKNNANIDFFKERTTVFYIGIGERF